MKGENMDDLISRQALIQALNKYADENNQDTDIHEAIEIAINLPTVQPKTGHWIYSPKHRGTTRLVCSNCGMPNRGEWNPYCFGCGSKNNEIRKE